MAAGAIGRLTSTVLDSSDPQRLARFYSGLLGWPISRADDPTWATLRPDGGGPGLSFQLESQHVRPEWPAFEGQQQMQSHLDIEVDDLAAGVERVELLGGRLAAWQPQDDVRVCLDLDGHPFCLWIEHADDDGTRTSGEHA